MNIISVKSHFENQLFQKKGVNGVMIGFKKKDGELINKISIVISVIEKLPKKQIRKMDMIPKTVGGVETDVIECNNIIKSKSSKKNTIKKDNICYMGTSGGHYKMDGAGTNGALFFHTNLKGKKTLCIGTCNHVGALSNKGNIGDPYLSPGPGDGGNIDNNIIGYLHNLIPVKTYKNPGQCRLANLISGLYNYSSNYLERKTKLTQYIDYSYYNFVDAALIKVNDYNVSPILDCIGIPKGIRKVGLDDLKFPPLELQKTGKKSGHTKDGILAGINCTIRKMLFNGEFANFYNQIYILKEENGFSALGDSGSLIFDMKGYAIGSLFHCTPRGKDTYANPIDLYLNSLGAELVTDKNWIK